MKSLNQIIQIIGKDVQSAIAERLNSLKGIDISLRFKLIPIFYPQQRHTHLKNPLFYFFEKKFYFVTSRSDTPGEYYEG